MEKKLTDEEIVKALEKCRERPYCEVKCEYKLARTGAECIPKLMGIALDLIRRLQYAYSSASKASEEWIEKYEAVLKDYYAEKQTCDEQKDIIANQKAEIERLTEYNANLNGMCLEFIDKNTELQKQVDELKEERYYTEQDTAKEILQELYEYPHEYHEKKILEIAKRYGVEVE